MEYNKHEEGTTGNFVVRQRGPPLFLTKNFQHLPPFERERDDEITDFGPHDCVLPVNCTSRFRIGKH